MMIKKLNFNYSEKGDFITPIRRNLMDWGGFMALIWKLVATFRRTDIQVNRHYEKNILASYNFDNPVRTRTDHRKKILSRPKIG